MNTIRPIGHPTLRLADIAPIKASFSPNLHKYLKAQGHFYRDGGIAQSVFTVRAGTRAADVYGAGTLMLGYVDDAYFIGTKMMNALCNGAKASHMAHPISDCIDEIEGFWNKYLLTGRCVIDTDHIHYFMGDRFDEQSETRTCRWCGHEQKKLVTQRLVCDTSWINA